MADYERDATKIAERLALQFAEEEILVPASVLKPGILNFLNRNGGDCHAFEQAEQVLKDGIRFIFKQKQK